MKRKPVILYGPTGDFNSIVKCMKVKLRYTSVDSESRFWMFRHFGYFLTLSLSLWVVFFFFNKGISQACALNLNLHFIVNKTLPRKHSFIH